MTFSQTQPPNGPNGSDADNRARTADDRRRRDQNLRRLGFVVLAIVTFVVPMVTSGKKPDPKPGRPTPTPTAMSTATPTAKPTATPTPTPTPPTSEPTHEHSPDPTPEDPPSDGVRRVWFEAQEWWNGPVGGGEPDRVAFPFRHVHLAVQIPYLDPVSGVVSVPFKAFTHGNVGELKLVKWQDDKGGSEQTLIVRPNIVLGPEQVFTGEFKIDTSKEVNSGWRLWRFYAVWVHPNGNEQVARPTYPVFVNNGKPRSDFAHDEWRPTGWYKEAGSTDWSYSIASMKIDSYDPFKPIGTVWRPELKIALNNRAGSPEVTAYSIHIDPDFHAGKIGTVVATGVGPGTITPAILSAGLAPGQHRLVVRTIQESGGKHAEAVGIFPFTV